MRRYPAIFAVVAAPGSAYLSAVVTARPAAAEPDGGCGGIARVSVTEHPIAGAYAGAVRRRQAREGLPRTKGGQRLLASLATGASRMKALRGGWARNVAEHRARAGGNRDVAATSPPGCPPRAVVTRGADTGAPKDQPGKARSGRSAGNGLPVYATFECRGGAVDRGLAKDLPTSIIPTGKPSTMTAGDAHGRVVGAVEWGRVGQYFEPALNDFRYRRIGGGQRRGRHWQRSASAAGRNRDNASL